MPNSPELPLIDVSGLENSKGDAYAETVRSIGVACREIGFFYVTGHGIAPDDLSNMFDASRRFFALDAPAKSALSIEHSNHNRGYVGFQGEQLEASRPADLKEAFNIGLELPADDPELMANVDFRGPNQWPSELPEWRSQMLAYYQRMLDLADRLHRAFAVDLGVAEDYFVPFMKRPLAVLRLLHYPAIPDIQATEGTAIGAGTHSDYGMLTLLLQDDVGGLQVQRRDGSWIEAPVVPGAFICNIGDMLMRWSNDVYKSTPHRVLNNPLQERFSIAMFCDPAPDAPVTCLPSCVSADRPAAYAPTTSGAYLTSRLNDTYAFRGAGFDEG